MAATASAPPAPGKGGGFLKRLNPQQRRLAIAIAAGGVLALFVLMRRGGGGGGGGSDTGTQPISPTDLAGAGAADGSTFADNGASAGQLNTTLTDLIGQFQTIEDLLNQPAPTVGTDIPLDAVPAPAIAAAPAALAATGGVRTAAAALKSKTVVKASAAHGGAQSVYRFTDTDPSKPGYEQKVYLRPAAAAAKPAAPAARPQGAAKLPAGVFLQDSGTRKGLRYVVEGGARRYESKAGAGNWGKGGVIKI